jgi:phosphoglycerate dehydrogenase-like enzyme
VVGGSSLSRAASSPFAVDGDRVLVTWLTYDEHDPETGALLRAAGLDVRHAPKHGSRTPAEVRALARDAVAAIVSTDPFDRSVFEGAPRLRVVARVGVGVDSIDVAAATDAGVVVTRTPGANTETTADHALALMLSVLRRIVEHDASVRRGEWERGGELTPWDLHGLTVGIVGFGSIGRAVARRLEGFAATVLVADPAVASANGFELVALDDLLARADVVSLHVPLVEATRGMIGERELARMRPGAILVNTSRGGLVDERSLGHALAAGRLRGAALDVFEDEPSVPRYLRRLENVVLTPHIGGLSVSSVARMVRLATRSVLDVLQGTPVPEMIANPEVLAHPRLRGGDPVGAVGAPDGA